MKKIALLSLIFLTILCSCSLTGPLSITNTDDLIEVQKIIDENFDKETELCYLTLSAGGRLSSTLSSINRKYKYKEKYFTDLYFLSDKKFTDPKRVSSPKEEKTFKVNDIDITIIPEKYNEALEILNIREEQNIGRAYHLNNWTFKADNVSTFTLNYYVTSSAHGRTTTTTYDSHNFKLNENGEVILLK